MGPDAPPTGRTLRLCGSRWQVEVCSLIDQLLGENSALIAGAQEQTEAIIDPPVPASQWRYGRGHPVAGTPGVPRGLIATYQPELTQLVRFQTKMMVTC